MRRPLLGAAVALCFAAPAALANPTGPTVVNGSASFAASGATLTVTNTPGAIINWQQFSIQQNEVTRFIQQNAASAVLNRVTSGIPSAILGTLSSNGRVFLINASGIAIGRGAMIDVAGFAASTLNLADTDFIAGRNLFLGTGAEGALVNAGTIRTAAGGHVYLVAPKVENQKDAVITSPGGEILIAAGRTVELVNAQLPDVRVEFTAAGEAVNAGAIVAASGQVGIFGTLVKNSGLVSASRAEVGPGGRIVFRSSGDTLLEAGSRVEATGDVGGSVQVLGERVGVLDGASIDASGDAGGGTVLVGGDFQGKNAAVPNAWRTYFGAGASIKADALAGGDGGRVIVWADDITRAYGEISARGGAAGGDGGFVEVSGKNQLDFAARVDASAPNGAAGTLLLDPTNITVATGGGATTAQVDAFADAGATLTIAPATLNAAGTTVVLQASNDININNTVNLTTAGAGFVAQAGDDIIVSAAITTNGGRIHLEADSPHAPGGSNGSGQLSVTANGALTSNGGHITLIGGGDSILAGGGIALTENHLIDAGAGGIDVALSGNADFGVGSLGLLTQIIGNPMDELHTTGALRIGTATTAGSDGLGTGAQTLLANSVTNIYPGSAIDLSPASGTTFEIYAGAGGIVLDQPLTTFQDTVINTTGTLTINDPINTTNNNLVISAANVNTGVNGSINTGTGACTGGGCPVSTIFWDGGGDGVNWFDPLNWSGDALPTASDIVNIDSSVGTIVIGASGALARSLIANRPMEITAAGTLSLVEASQFADLLTLAGGSLLGTGSASVTGPSGSLAWSGGTMGAGGAFQLVSGRSGTLSNALVLDRDFLNEGLLTLASATITGSGSFANAGTLTAAAGTTNSIANAFQNIVNTITGTLQVDGALTLGDFPLNEGTIAVAASGTFSVGALENTGTVTVDGAASIGTLTLTAGTVDGTGDLTVGTDFNANGGTLGTTLSDLSLTKSGAFAVDSFTAVDSISLTAGGAISDANGAAVNVTAPVVSLSAVGGISLDTATTALTTSNATSGDTSIRNTGAVTVNGMTSTGNVTLTSTAGITLAADITGGGASDIVLAGTSFDNSGDHALNAGRFLVWSADPASDDRGNLAYDFKQYNANFGSSTVLGTGDGFLYTAAPTITASLTGAVSREYDATTAAALAGGNYSFSGAIDGDTVTLNNPASGTFDTKNVGTGKTVSVSGIAISSATDGAATVFGYQLASTSASGAIGEITAASLTGSITASDKVYDATTAATISGRSLSGVLLTDNVSYTGGTATFDTKNVGTGKTVSATGLSLAGADAGNYTVNTTAATTADVTAASLTGSITASDKVYDATTAATISGRSLSGVLLTDDVSYTGGTATFDTKNVGTGKTVTGTGLSLAGADAGNYTVNTTAATTADVTQASLTGSITASDKVYDATTAATISGRSLTGVLLTDDVSYTGGTATFDTKNVGTGKTVTGTGLSLAGADAGNYTVNTTAATTADVTAATLTGSITASDKVYDATTAATISGRSLSGVLLTDDVTYTGGTATFDTKNVGTGKTVTGTGLALSGADAGNYTVNTSAVTTADVTQATLTGSITASDKVYDATTAATISGRSLTGVLLTDDVSYTGGTATFDTKNVGTGKTVSATGLALAGVDAGNYTVNTTAATTADVTAATLTGSITASDKVYDATTAATISGRSLSGVLLTDDVSYTGGTATFDTKNVGTGKTVTGTGLSLAGADAGNYTVNTTAATTADVTAATLTGSITASDKVYDATTAATISGRSLSGVLLTDDVSYTGGTATFDTKNVGTGKTVTGTGLALSGADAGNYTVNATAATTADVTPASLTGSITASDKVYDATTAATISGRSLTGVLLTDDVSYTGGTATFDTRHVGAGKTVSANGLSITGADAGNYTVNATAATTAAITPAALTLLAAADTKTYDGTTASIAAPTASGLFGSDSVTGLAQSFDSKDAGARTLAVNGGFVVNDGNGGNNYAVSLTTAAGTIDPALLLYVADAAARNAGEPNPAFTGQVSGFVAGETLATATSGSLLWASPADAASPAGSYAIDGSGLTALNGNYTFAQAPGNAAALTIVAVAAVPPAALTPPPAPPPPEGSIVPQGEIDTTLLNLNTGESVFVAPNSIPDPGIYLSQDASSVVVVGESDLGSQLNVASTLLFPVVSYSEGLYVNSENGLLYDIEDGAVLDPGVYYNREDQTVLVVTTNEDGNVTVSSADIKDAVQTVATGAGGRRVVSVACR